MTSRAPPRMAIVGWPLGLLRTSISRQLMPRRQQRQLAPYRAMLREAEAEMARPDRDEEDDE